MGYCPKNLVCSFKDFSKVRKELGQTHRDQRVPEGSAVCLHENPTFDPPPNHSVSIPHGSYLHPSLLLSVVSPKSLCLTTKPLFLSGFGNSTVGPSNDTHTHMHTHWLMRGGGGVHSKLTLFSSSLWLVYTCALTCVRACVVVLFWVCVSRWMTSCSSLL